MNDDKKLENLEDILTKDEILKLYESVAEGAKPVMLAKNVCKCGGGSGPCSCHGSSGSKGCCG